MPEGTGFQFGLSGDDQIRIACQHIAKRGGSAPMRDLYGAVEAHLGGNTLSHQGKSSLRFFVNEVAVDSGYIKRHDPRNPGWHLTSAGYRLAGVQQPPAPAPIGTPVRTPPAVPAIPPTGNSTTEDDTESVRALVRFLDVARAQATPTLSVSSSGLAMMEALLKSQWPFKVLALDFDTFIDAGAVHWKLVAEFG